MPPLDDPNDLNPDAPAQPKKKTLRQTIEDAVGAQEAAAAPAVTREKVPGVNGLTNPMPFPENHQAGVERGLTRRRADTARSRGETSQKAIRLGGNDYLGDVNVRQWKRRMEGQLNPDEITSARNWYKDALPVYEKYFGKEHAPAMMGAWLIANRNVDPSGAQLNALRIDEQLRNETQKYSTQKKGGLAHDSLMNYWNAIRSGDMSDLGREGGQKIYDFIDSALGKNTRTFYGDDPRMGGPAVADIHSLRDMGHIDAPTLAWVKKKYGADVAAKLVKTYGGTPSEAQYEWSADKLRKFSNQLNKEGYMGGGWTPEQVQAAGWMTMSRMLGRQGQTAEQAITRHVRNISSELDFGKGAPYHQQFPEWAGLSPEAKARITEKIQPLLHDFAAKETGAHAFQTMTATGGWGKYTNPSMKARLIASPEVASDYANIIGHLAQQTEVFGYRPEAKGNKLGLAIHGQGLENPETVRKLWEQYTAAHPKLAAGFSPSIHPDTGHHGIEMIFDKGGKRMAEKIANEAHPTLARIAQGLDVGDLHIQPFRARTTRSGNDWEADQTGQGYLAPLSRRYGPDLPNRMELYQRQTLEPAIRGEIDRELARGGGEAGAQAGEAPPEIAPPESETPSETPPAAPEEGAVPRPAPARPAIRPSGLVNMASASGAPEEAPEGEAIPSVKAGAVERVLGSKKKRGLLTRALASEGEKGDTELAHIEPEEAAELEQAGGAGTTNPKTGLPEFYPVRPGSAPMPDSSPVINTEQQARQFLADHARRMLITQALAQRGQRGDTMLAHLTPQEELALKLTGGVGTRNPATGIRQFYGGGYGHASGDTNAGDPASAGSSGGYEGGKSIANRDPRGGPDMGVSGGADLGIGAGVGGDLDSAISGADLGLGGVPGHTQPRSGGPMGGGGAAFSGQGPDTANPMGGGGVAAGGGSADTSQQGDWPSAPAGAILGPLAGSPVTNESLQAQAEAAIKRRDFGTKLAENLLGLDPMTPDVNNPASIAGGTYHTEVNPGSILGGLAGSVVAPGIGGLLGSELVGGAYDWAGGPKIATGDLGFHDPGSWGGPAVAGGGTAPAGGSSAPAAGGGGGGGGFLGGIGSGIGSLARAAGGALASGGGPAGGYGGPSGSPTGGGGGGARQGDTFGGMPAPPPTAGLPMPAPGLDAAQKRKIMLELLKRRAAFGQSVPMVSGA